MSQNRTAPLYPYQTPPPTERDKTLGQFIDAWDSLDQHARLVFSTLVGTPNDISKMVLGLSQQANQFRAMLLLLGKVRLQEKDYITLDRLSGRFEKMATKRNRIVHGHWHGVQGHPTFRGDPQFGGKWVRIYDPVDAEIFYLVATPDMGGKEHARARARYAFDIPRICELTAVCRNITTDWNNFAVKLRARAWPETGQAPQSSPKLPEL